MKNEIDNHPSCRVKRLLPGYIFEDREFLLLDLGRCHPFICRDIGKFRFKDCEYFNHDRVKMLSSTFRDNIEALLMGEWFFVRTSGSERVIDIGNYLASTSLILVAIASRENGFWIKCMPSSRMPWRAMTLAV